MAKSSTSAKLKELILLLKSGTRTFQQIDDAVQRRVTRGVETSFSYTRKTADGEPRVIPCNPPTIRRHLGLAQELGLVSDFEPFALTIITQQAATPADMNRLIEVQLVELLEKRDCSLSKINAAIREVHFPEPEHIYAALKPPPKAASISEDQFRRYLFLLSEVSSVVVPYRKKLYLLPS